jgi:hypothetical protein
MSQSADICALCKHFKMKDHPKHASVGLGRCAGQKGSTAPAIKPFVHWARKACRQYAPAANRAERAEWVEKRMAKEQFKATPTAVTTREKK